MLEVPFGLVCMKRAWALVMPLRYCSTRAMSAWSLALSAACCGGLIGWGVGCWAWAKPRGASSAENSIGASASAARRERRGVGLMGAISVTNLADSRSVMTRLRDEWFRLMDSGC